MAKKPCRLYCSLAGCLNTTLTHPDMTFFKLPGDAKRRFAWLKLIDRDELGDRPNYSAYRVCETHFHEDDILKSNYRKIVTKNALPLLNLPDYSNYMGSVGVQRDKQNQTSMSLIGDTKSTQTIKTEKTARDIQTQTTLELLYSIPKVAVMKTELLKCRKQLAQKDAERKTKKAEKKQFHQLCDKFLSSKLALLIKAQSKLKLHGKGNRYDEEHRNFCLKLFRISPQAYRFLQSTLCLPCPSTLYKLKKSGDKPTESTEVSTSTEEMVTEAISTEETPQDCKDNQELYELISTSNELTEFQPLNMQ